MVWGNSSVAVVEHLPTMCETLGLILAPQKKKEEKYL
jgi:hypothetical protein